MFIFGFLLLGILYKIHSENNNKKTTPFRFINSNEMIFILIVGSIIVILYSLFSFYNSNFDYKTSFSPFIFIVYFIICMIYLIIHNEYRKNFSVDVIKFEDAIKKLKSEMILSQTSGVNKIISFVKFYNTNEQNLLLIHYIILKYIFSRLCEFNETVLAVNALF